MSASVSAALYAVGSCFFMTASACILPALPAGVAEAGKLLYVAGSLAFLAAALMDLLAALRRRWVAGGGASTAGGAPSGHLQRDDDDEGDANEGAADALIRDSSGVNASPIAPKAPAPPSSLPRLAGTTEALVVSALFALGSALFVLGSVVFLPAFAALDPPALLTGTAIFSYGCGCYVLGAAIAVVQLLWPSTTAPVEAPTVPNAGRHNTVILTLVTLALYAAGSLLFIVGGVLYDSGIDDEGAAALYIVGSATFLVGSICAMALSRR